jgi:hypothetical protein
VYDGNEDWYAQIVGPEFGEVLRHAVYIIDPVLAAAAWDEAFEWAEEHKVLFNNHDRN